MEDPTLFVFFAIAGLLFVATRLQRAIREGQPVRKAAPAVQQIALRTTYQPPPEPPPQPVVTRPPMHPLAWFYYLATQTVHILVVGETNSGKTTLARALIAFLSKRGIIVSIDPKNKGNPDMPGMSLSWGIPNKYIIGHGFKGAFPWIAQTLERLNTELEDRLERLANGEEVGPHIYIFIDEWYTISHNPICKDIAGRFMAQLAVLSREARMHLIIMAHGKTLESLGLKDGQSEIRENFTLVKLGRKAHAAVGGTEGIVHPVVLDIDEVNILVDPTHSAMLPDLAREEVRESAFWIPVAKETLAEAPDNDPFMTDTREKVGANPTSNPVRIMPLQDDVPAEVYTALATLIVAGLIKQTPAVETVFRVSAGGGKYQRYNAQLKVALEKIRSESVSA